MGSLGEFNWGGAAGTSFWIDPKEHMIGVFLINVMPNAGNVAAGQFKRRRTRPWWIDWTGPCQRLGRTATVKERFGHDTTTSPRKALAYTRGSLLKIPAETHLHQPRPTIRREST